MRPPIVKSCHLVSPLVTILIFCGMILAMSLFTITKSNSIFINSLVLAKIQIVEEAKQLSLFDIMNILQSHVEVVSSVLLCQSKFFEINNLLRYKLFTCIL